MVIPDDLRPSHSLVLQCLHHGTCTVRTVEIYTGLTSKTVAQALRDLFKWGWAEVRKNAIYGERWSLTRSGREVPTTPTTNCGKRCPVSDARLIQEVAKGGGIRQAARRLGYLDDGWLRRRLRKLGLPPGLPGRPYDQVSSL